MSSGRPRVHAGGWDLGSRLPNRLLPAWASRPCFLLAREPEASGPALAGHTGRVCVCDAWPSPKTCPLAVAELASSS